MKIFCDTSVLVAASLQTHLQHEPAKAALLRIRQGHDEGYACAHALAETFSVLSRMPTKPKLLPEDVLDILKQDIIPYFVFVALQPSGGSCWDDRAARPWESLDAGGRLMRGF